MKKKIAMALAVGLVLSCLQGCGSTNEPSNESEASSEQTGAEVSAGDEESESAIVLEPSNEENEDETALKHYDPTPEILEATWGDGMFQVADMVFCINNTMSDKEVRAIIDASESNMQWAEFEYVNEDGVSKPKTQIVDKDGNEQYFFEWTWHSVDNQRYYDVAEGEEGWYLSGFYVGADIESLVGCDRDSWYIDGGIPVDPTPGTSTLNSKDLIAQYDALGAIDDTRESVHLGGAFNIYFNDHDVDIENIPIGIYTDNGGLAIQDNKWSGSLDPKGNKRFSTILYSFRTDDDGTITNANMNIAEQYTEQKLRDWLLR